MAEKKPRAPQDEIRREYEKQRKELLSDLQELAGDAPGFTRRLIEEARNAIAKVEPPTLPELPVVADKARELIAKFEEAARAVELDGEKGSSESTTNELLLVRHLALRRLLTHIHRLERQNY